MIIQWTYGAVYQPHIPGCPVYNWLGTSATLVTNLEISTQYECFQIASDGLNYHIVGKYTPA